MPEEPARAALPKQRRVGRVAGLLLLVLIIAALYYLFQAQIFLFIKANPALAHIYAEILGRTALGLFYISMASSLFFVMFPAEAVILYFLFIGFSPLLVTALLVAGSVIALAFNYLFGLVVGERVLRWYLQKRYERWAGWMKRWGGLVVFTSNAIFFPSEILAVMVGGLRYPFKRFILYSALGRVVKCALMYAVYLYAMQHILPYLAIYFPELGL